MIVVIRVNPGCAAPVATHGFTSQEHARAWAIEQATEMAEANGWKVDTWPEVAGHELATITVVDSTSFAVLSHEYDYADIRTYWSVCECECQPSYVAPRIYDTTNPRIIAAHKAGEETALRMAAEGSFSPKYIAMATVQDAFMTYDGVPPIRPARENPLT